jgi:hypothetical protein
MAEEAPGDDVAAGDFQQMLRHADRFVLHAIGDKRRPARAGR